MGKGKDFYGKDIAEVIEQACKELGASQEDLDIEVLETGSAGIFGLCKKKAHIRVQRRQIAPVVEATVALEKRAEPEEEVRNEESVPIPEPHSQPIHEDDADEDVESSSQGDLPDNGSLAAEEIESRPGEEQEPLVVETPTDEGLAAIQDDLHHLLTLMGLPSQVDVRFEDNTVQCHIQGPHEEQIVGAEGRTLDSLQYLLRKMVSSHLPDRIMLALNAGDFRERRAEELKVRAVELASMVKADGKTQSIPALNPSERRVVHMILQEDKGVRSRSVGEGLFKKVLIYKPGKGRRPASKKRRGGQGGRSSGD